MSKLVGSYIWSTHGRGRYALNVGEERDPICWLVRRDIGEIPDVDVEAWDIVSWHGVSAVSLALSPGPREDWLIASFTTETEARIFALGYACSGDVIHDPKRGDNLRCQDAVTSFAMGLQQAAVDIGPGAPAFMPITFGDSYE